MSTTGTGLDWVLFANDRPIGRTEFRKVVMEIGSGRRARILKIRTLRQIDGNRSRSLFCVIEPSPLSNINYVVTEYRGQIEPLTIELYFPYARGTLRRLPSDRRREGHLGSDFSYDDLRTWLYEEGHIYTTTCSTGSSVEVTGCCKENFHLVRSGSAPFNIFLDKMTGFVNGIDYRSSDGSKVAREYRAEDLTTIGGVAIAGKMTMFDREQDHRTSIYLEGAWYNQPIDPGVFEASFRKHSKEYLAKL